jgi:tripartite-type tricarboxylate transporter receptor subunit TctC
VPAAAIRDKDRLRDEHGGRVRIIAEETMGRRTGLFAGAAGIVIALGSGAPPAAAQTSAEFYVGKTVSVIIGFGPGGGYDRWGRTVARHIGKHLPGKPTVVAQNMPGAGSYVAASHIYNVAPRDGTVLGIIARDAPLGPLTGASGARFDPLRLSWIGTTTKETNVCLAFHKAQVKTVHDLFDKTLIVGDTGPGTGTRTYPKVLNALLGMNFRLVGGFPASTDVFLAIERGEVEGICESYDSVMSRKPDWVRDKIITFLFQGGAVPNPALKDIPFVLDFAKTEEQRRALEFVYAGQGIGRPFVSPPELPPERLAMLRKAFDATVRDPEFIAEVKKSRLDLDPEDGAYLEALIRKIYATPKSLVERIGEIIK